MRRASALLALLLITITPIPSNEKGTSLPNPIASAGPLGSTDYPWLMFHHDSLRTGTTLASAPSAGNLAWSYATGGAVYASPAVSDGMVFISSWDGRLYALDEKTGNLLWSFTTGTSIFSSPAVANGVVYVGSRNGIMYAINEQTGALIWGLGNSNCAVTSSPVVSNGKVFYGTWTISGCVDQGQFIARYANNGTAYWTNATIASSTVRSSPAVDSGLVFFGQDNGEVLALNETTGKQAWTASLSGAAVMVSAPAVANGRLYVGTDNGFLVLNEFTGARITPFLSPNTNTTSAAVSGGAIYFGSGAGYVYKVNANTGAQIWNASLGAAVDSSPALALGTNTLVVGSNNGYLYDLNMTTGGTVWKYLIGGQVSSSPAIADGKAFVGSTNSRIIAIGSSPPPPSQLQVTVSSSASTLRPGQQSILTITVTNGTTPESGASITLASSAAGVFTQVVEKSPGSYQSNYTAPLAFSLSSTTISVTAAKAGFLNGSAQRVLTLEPFSSLTVTVTIDSNRVAPGASVHLQIRVLNGTNAIAGATITLTSTGAGSFSSVSDAGNGNYTAAYATGVQDSGSKTLSVQAEKSGFSQGQSQVMITLSGSSDLTDLNVLGLPVLLLVGLAIVLSVCIIGLLFLKRKKPESNSPAVPSYLLGWMHFFSEKA